MTEQKELEYQHKIKTLTDLVKWQAAIIEKQHPKGMKFADAKKKIDAYFEKTSPAEIIKDLEALGVEFVDANQEEEIYYSDEVKQKIRKVYNDLIQSIVYPGTPPPSGITRVSASDVLEKHFAFLIKK